MKIAPLTTNHIARNFHYNPTFKSETSSGPDYNYDKKPFSQHDPLDEDEFLFIELPDDEDDGLIPYDEYPPSYTKNMGCTFWTTIVAAITSGALFLNHHINEQNAQHQDAINLIQTDNIQKDTFTVKDINGDKVPELILYKKDGSPIVVDFANEKIK